ncbi:sigma-70 family RNA polymerase sigma factor [Plantibacter sp. Mn2098]|uniref:sigma-70 family RNA polymerase sigma factor n=1 Tax=Plantibacter sp. Mn2098 TaxID=3395266 RepID=UPI003BBBBD77
MTNGTPVAGLDRDRLVGLAYRMLGTVADAEDAVQEAFVRWYRLDEGSRAAIGNPIGWFAKTTSRICLDVLKSAPRRHGQYVGPWLPEPVPDARFRAGSALDAQDPAERAIVSESVSMALLAVMEVMTPAERVAFVLRDVFDYSAADIAEVLDRSPGAVRQLATSARARIADRDPVPGPGNARLSAAFQRAATSGDVAALVQLLHPEVTLRSDGGGVVRAALNTISGAAKVARFIVGVLERQPSTTLVVRQAEAGTVLTFNRDGLVSGVLELVDDADEVTEVLIQWNPHKLRLWNEAI